MRTALVCAILFGTGWLAPGAERIQLIDYKSVWKYEQPSLSAGRTWLEPDYSDDQWHTGPGVFVWPKGENLLGLSSAGTLLEADERKGATWRFRFHFRLPYPKAGLQLTCTNLVDDNAILYLNGKEVGRAGRFLSREQRTASWDVSQDGPVVLNLPTENLHEGNNVLAVELGQIGSFSSDAVFALSLWAEDVPPGPPTITEQLSHRSVAEGDRVTFSTRVHGRTPLAFQWRKDGVDLPGAVGASYTIASVDAESLGNYSYKVRNSYGSVTSSNVTLSLDVTTLIPFSQKWRYDISGRELNERWKELEFDDSQWLSGDGPLGSPQTAVGQSNFKLATVLPRSVPSTTYFRTTFRNSAIAEDVELRLTAEVDDGAIFYLNGSELVRLGLPPGIINFNTTGSRGTRPGVPEVLSIPTSKLLPGLNSLAVEIHQSPSTGERDVVARIRLAARLPPPTWLEITQQPQDVRIIEGRTAQVDVQVRGARGQYQWFRDDVLLPVAQRSSYQIAQSKPTDAGRYHATISNLTGVVKTRYATVTVVPHTNGPIVLAANGENSANEISIHFSEPLDPATSTNARNYRLIDAEEKLVGIIRTRSDSKTNVVITTETRDPLKNYVLSVSGVRSTMGGTKVMAAERRLPVSRRLRLVGFEDQWRVGVAGKGWANRKGSGRSWEDVAESAEWKQARAPFATSPALRPLPLVAGSPLAGNQVTTYFQHPFEFWPDTRGASLFLRHAIADGAYFYLNGARILRFNMPAAPPNEQTTARRRIREISLSEALPLPHELARPGTNILAAELHAALGGKPSLFFAAELFANVYSLAKGPIHITVNPIDVTIQEGRPFRLQVEGVGVSRWEWFQNDRLLPDRSGETLKIERAPLDLNGTQFFVRASNQDHMATSAVAKVTVVADSEAPQVVATKATGNTLTLTFSEPVTLNTATQLVNYSLTTRLGGSNAITNVLSSSDTTVTLQARHQLHVNDVLTISGLRDQSRASHVMEHPANVVIGFDGTLVSFASLWKYDQSGVEPDAAWREREFDDRDWLSGAGLLGEEDTPLSEPIRTPLLCVTNGGAVTTYFRSAFYLPEKPAIDSLLLRYYVDDGALFYLNGHLVHAVGASANTSFTSLSERIVVDTSREGPFAVTGKYLQAGLNVLAAEVHQASAQNGDIVFGAELCMPSSPYIIQDGGTKVGSRDLNPSK